MLFKNKRFWGREVAWLVRCLLGRLEDQSLIPNIYIKSQTWCVNNQWASQASQRSPFSKFRSSEEPCVKSKLESIRGRYLIKTSGQNTYTHNCAHMNVYTHKHKHTHAHIHTHREGGGREIGSLTEFLSQCIIFWVLFKNTNTNVWGWRDNQWLRAVVALGDGLNLVSTIHMLAHDHL